MRSDQATLTTRCFAGLCACGAALLALSLVARHGQWTDDFQLFVPVAYAQGVVYAVGAWIVLQDRFATLDKRLLISLIVVVAVALRLIALATPPNFLSTDLYRYIWDGRVQGAGVNPYLYVPADPALAHLRDEGVYSHINRLDTAPTIYAPFAQLVFFAVTRLGESVTAMRLAMLGFEVVTVLALALLLRRLGQPLHRLYLYLWHPLPVWEIACGAHVDAVLTAMALLALLAAMTGRRGLSGALLAAATLTKFFPLIIAPVLYRRFDWKMPAAALALTGILYGIYVLNGGGWHVLGFLPGYASEEGLAAGEGVFILSLLRGIGLAPLPAMLAYLALALGVLGTLVLRALARDRDIHSLPALAAWLATATLVLISPHYPWYFVWIAAFICLVPRFSLIYLTCSVFFLYVTDSPTSLTTGFVIYGPFLALLLFEQRRFVVPLLQEGSIS
ncbi:Protein of unknown function [Rhizobiales bacterium GAS188]|nr:Protein of unknown function [Rhizobiales bacterium GAS188]